MLMTVAFPIEWERLAARLPPPFNSPWHAHAIRESTPHSMRVNYDGIPADAIEVIVDYPALPDDPERILPSPFGLVAVEPRYGNPTRFSVKPPHRSDACADIARLMDIYLAYCRALTEDRKDLNLYSGRAIRWQWDDIAQFLGYKYAPS